MPRNYKRVTEKASWREEELQGALRAIQNGMSLRKAAIKFSIPKSTLHERLKNGTAPSGPSLDRKPVFSVEAENALAVQIKKLAKVFYGITPQEVRRCAFGFAQSNNIRVPFNQERKMAGKDWERGFISRHNITLRKPEATSINRITAFSRNEVTIFFNNLSRLMEKYAFSPNKIYNCDETGVTTVQRPPKIYAEKGQKRVGFVTSWERGKTTTAMCAVNATGTYIPPMFIFARQRMASHLQRNGPPGALYTCSKNGWITEDIFLTWLQHFQAFVKASKEDPVLLIMDNHSTHCTLQAYNFCRDNGIAVLTIPPHSSHSLQPLDVSFYFPLKTAFNSECSKYLTSHPGEKITPSEIAELFNLAFSRVATPEKAIKGFKETGIFPYNPDVFTDEDFAPAETLQSTVSDALQEPTQAEKLLKTNETTPEKNSSVNETELKNVSFAEIIPLPSCSHENVVKRQNKANKQHSIVFTSTPLKEELEKKEEKKNKKTTIKSDKAKRNVFVTQEGSTLRQKSKRTKIALNYKICEEGESKIEDDDDVRDKNITEDICILCGEFGKNSELWLRCVYCGHWAQKACSNSPKDKKFICDFCL
ncbi:tigger transposable element-derived protein 4-like [Diabrotica virgifera virgifera]|uniref:HTH psq-type domain-containing protein n=1 Tax=Diabrotica virgifera virgifera TaxID=50390 RepID=A0ABM5JPG1_DIAVI|nr:tigger transposable element-derived protein 4-like [Diabrotica virgifera virgifera]